MTEDLLTDVKEYGGHIYKFTLWPRLWRNYDDSVGFDWKTVTLEISQRENIPKDAGVYTLLVNPGIARHPGTSYLMYVGKSNDLHRRFGEYLNERKRFLGRPKIYRLLNFYNEYVFFCFSLLPENEINRAEEELQKAYVPPANDRLPADIRNIVEALR